MEWVAEAALTGITAEESMTASIRMSSTIWERWTIWRSRNNFSGVIPTDNELAAAATAIDFVIADVPFVCHGTYTHTDCFMSHAGTMVAFRLLHTETKFDCVSVFLLIIVLVG